MIFELNNLKSVKLGIASPDKIREWSYGEVTKPETINYRTQKPEPDGLFCEKIFGPTKDWQCRCGKYKLIRYKGVVCDRCGVEVTRSKVRRERMGHIELATPVSHIWYFKGVPSRISIILDLTPKTLEHVLYYVNHIVIDPGTTPLNYKQILSDKECSDARELYGEDSFRVGMGAEAIKELLAKIDLQEEKAKLVESMAKDKTQKIKSVRKLELVEAFLKSKNDPKWMILDVIPVIPPDLRPMVQLDGGRFASSDLNDLYRRVINRNNRLKKMMEIGAPEVIIRNEKRMLQEAVDALIENGKRGKAVTGPKQESLRSLTNMLKGKQGRFRQNLLGKRVDYSGRSVIVVGPELKMYQCGLPKEMALELFKPFIMNKLVKRNAANNIKSAKKMIDQAKPIVWDVLDEVIKGHPVILNRAPTLHRLGIQAFEPILTEGRAIRLHPLVCKGFHADFDGDQMPVHIPLSLESRAEARNILLSTNNILLPSDGKPVVTPTKDMVIGGYYLTICKEGTKGEGKYFSSEDEAIIAHGTDNLDLQAKIFVKREALWNGEIVRGKVETTVGRILFNKCIPQSLGFVDRSIRENVIKYEIDFPVVNTIFEQLTERCYNIIGGNATVEMLDKIKDIGFHYLTLSGITVNLYDIVESPDRQKLIDECEAQIDAFDKQYRRGLITSDEKKDLSVNVWVKATSSFTSQVMESLPKYNSLRMMADAGARLKPAELNQMAGIRGIVANVSGKRVDVPVKSNYKLGFSPIEYFMSSRGGRKVLADTALKTSSSGYLTRRLVEVAQDVVVTEEDCFESFGETVKGFTVHAVKHDGKIVETLESRIKGRYTSKDVINPKTKEIIIGVNQLVTEDIANKIVKAGIEEVEIRTLFTCKCKHGVCAKCYGKNMVNNHVVPVGEAVGIIAAQAIGEPGTQLSMKNFSAGVVGGNDITQGLPRVEEIFEARIPKGMAYISEIAGKVSLVEKDKRWTVIVTGSEGDVSYQLPFGARLKVKNGDRVEPGDALTEGSINPNALLKTKGVKGVQEYLLEEVLAVYRPQGVSINAKHIEIIIRQMLRKVKIENAGDTSFIPGEYVDLYTCEEENQRVLMEGGIPALVKREVKAITKVSKMSESFLSAASFQETSSALTDAAVKGKIDNLVGLKENVIVGKIIPAGTGYKDYKNVSPVLKGIDETIVEKEDNDEIAEV